MKEEWLREVLKRRHMVGRGKAETEIVGKWKE
jgi:hypothetical protein